MLPNHSDEEWEAWFSELRANESEQTRPFFYQRLRAKLEARQIDDLKKLPFWIRRPSYALAGLSLLVLLNVVIGGLYYEYASVPKPTALATTQEEFVVDYQLDRSPIDLDE
ncbi:hypothetical protein [Tellurirhabdus bombi]|uniref:hypothetical protein n=1 Tax=Tellurirhabdus bombi TaxID=2907205 RepID=UPI001F197180|nr:hypothetical protein [Tellurirhabdus bombi]